MYPQKGHFVLEPIVLSDHLSLQLELRCVQNTSILTISYSGELELSFTWPGSNHHYCCAGHKLFQLDFFSLVQWLSVLCRYMYYLMSLKLHRLFTSKMAEMVKAQVRNCYGVFIVKDNYFVIVRALEP